MKKITRVTLLVLAIFVVLVLSLNLVPYEDFDLSNSNLGSSLDLDGAAIRYWQTGIGADVLFIHGFPGSIEIFKSLVPHLGDDLRLTMYDRPGFGFSSLEGHRFDLAYEVEVAVGLIQRLNLQNVTVVGYSAGGPVAAQLALDHPELVRHVVLLSSVLAQEELESDPMVNTFSSPLIGKPLAFIFRHTMGEQMLRGLFADIAAEDEAKAEALFEDVHEIWLQTRTIVTMCKEMKNFTTRDAAQLLQRLPDLTTRTTIIFGKNDSFQVVEDAYATDRLLPNSELLLLDDAGHFVHYLHPEKVAEIILKCATS